ncbi:MAG TPA: hypothetical protein VJ725_29985 [Thermoanaerobaculia bacterium]|nr:hypothetical protein [Thermoanaerobaculia bacterium]
MDLVRLGVGRWDVLVTEQVVEVLTDFSSAKGPKKAMLSFLTESLPMNGPQEGNRTVCKQLKPGSLKLSEFRKGEYPGTKIRVIWFYGDEATKLAIVCIRAFAKNDQEAPSSEIRAAVALREQYLDARSRDSLRIEELS